MSSAPDTTSSNFEALFDAALERYTKQTGKDLLNHPLVHRIDGCNSPNSILEILQEQAQMFDQFRNGDTKLIKWLQPVVNGVHSLSTSASLNAGASLVSPTNFVIICQVYLNVQTLGIPTCQCNFLWN